MTQLIYFFDQRFFLSFYLKLFLTYCSKTVACCLQSVMQMMKQRLQNSNLKSMKKIFTLSILTIGLFIFFTGCVKNREYIDESYWLSKERGEVVLSDPYCQYFVIETNYGYSILRSYDGYKPQEGSIVYGDFSVYGTRDYYNRSNGVIYTGEVKEYGLTYYDAQDAINYYCY